MSGCGIPDWRARICHGLCWARIPLPCGLLAPQHTRQSPHDALRAHYRHAFIRGGVPVLHRLRYGEQVPRGPLFRLSNHERGVRHRDRAALGLRAPQELVQAREQPAARGQAASAPHSRRLSDHRPVAGLSRDPASFDGRVLRHRLLHAGRDGAEGRLVLEGEGRPAYLARAGREFPRRADRHAARPGAWIYGRSWPLPASFRLRAAW